MRNTRPLLGFVTVVVASVYYAPTPVLAARMETCELSWEYSPEQDCAVYVPETYQNCGRCIYICDGPEFRCIAGGLADRCAWIPEEEAGFRMTIANIGWNVAKRRVARFGSERSSGSKLVCFGMALPRRPPGGRVSSKWD